MFGEEYKLWNEDRKDE